MSQTPSGSRQRANGEERLYDAVQRCLTGLFAKLNECRFEVTNRNVSETIKRFLDDNSLHIAREERLLPDVMGYVITGRTDYSTSAELVVVEFKDGKVRVKDVLQAKNYGLFFGSRYCLLLSTQALPEEVRRFYEKKPDIGGYYANNGVKIGKFSVSDKVAKIEPHSWLPEPPFMPACQVCKGRTSWNRNKQELYCGSCSKFQEMPAD